MRRLRNWWRRRRGARFAPGNLVMLSAKTGAPAGPYVIAAVRLLEAGSPCVIASTGQAAYAKWPVWMCRLSGGPEWWDEALLHPHDPPDFRARRCEQEAELA